MKFLRATFLPFLLMIAVFLASAPPVSAQSGSVLGIHILEPDELDMAKKLVSPEIDGQQDEEWHYMTIPLPLDDVGKYEEWQAFFNRARDQKVIPIVRLVTRFEDGSWQVPNRKEVVDQISFLGNLDWPTDQKHIIIHNEVNHAAEWGGTIDPEGYAKVLNFTSRWAHFADKNFVVLPAALDLAAPNGPVTAEAFTYFDQMLAADPTVFEYIDYWNSHSYPNPGFSSSPERTAKNSLRGFEYELAYLKEKTGRDYQVFITETGWVANNATLPWLETYYSYALEHIWSDSRVIAVTPFVLRGDPGPFSGFAFIDRNNQPTRQYTALQNALKKRNQKQPS